MGFKKQKLNVIQGLITLVLAILPVAVSININCNGKAFHCVNSTHFMICVDLGGGLSSTIDDFIIPCPPTTECHTYNRFECEFPRITTPLPTLKQLVSTTPATTTILESTTTLTQNISAKTDTPQNVLDNKTHNYFNTAGSTTAFEKGMNTVVNSTEATFNLDVKTSKNTNEITVAPESTTTYDKHKFLLDENTQGSSSTLITNQETETPPIDQSSIQSIGVVIVNTTDNKNGKHTIHGEISFINNEINKQSMPKAYATKYVLSATLDQLNTSKMTEIVNSNASEITQIDKKKFTSAPMLSTDLITERSDSSTTTTMKNLPHTTHSSTATNHGLPTVYSNTNEVISKTEVRGEIFVPTTTEKISTSSTMDGITESLSTTDGNQLSPLTFLQDTILTTPSNFATSYLQYNLSKKISNKNEVFSMVDTTTEMSFFTVPETIAVSDGIDVTSETMLNKDYINPNNSEVSLQNTVAITLNTVTTDISNQNHSDILPNNIIANTSSLVTSLDGSSKIPIQNASVNEMFNKTETTTETMTSSANEPVTVSSGINSTFKTPFTEDVKKQNYSEIILNNVSTPTSNIVTSYEETKNNILIQNSSVNEAATKADVSTDITVSLVTEITTVADGMDVTSITLSVTDIGEQNRSDIIPTNIIATTPRTVTSLDESSKTRIQNTSVSDIVNKPDATTETMASLVNELVTTSTGINATSKTPFTEDAIKQNNSEIILNNVSTPTSNIITGIEGTNNNTQIQNSSVNETTTKAGVSTDTTVSSVTDISTVASGMDVISTTLSITEIGEQNHDKIPSYIKATTPNTVTSLDGSSKIPVQNTNVNNIVNKGDATTETMTSSANELVTASSGINATSKTQFTGDVIKQNNSEIILNNVSTQTSNIKTSFEGTNNNTLIQNSSVHEAATKANVATDTTVSSVTDITTVAGGMDVTSTTLSITDIGEQNHSDIIPTNIITTTPSTVTSLDGSSKIPVQSTNVNDIVNKVDATTETMASSGNEPVTASSGINATSKTPFTGDVIKQNNSEIILNNVSTQTSNIKTSFEGTNNNTLIQNSSVHEAATKANVATDTTVSSVTDITTVAGGMDVTSTTLSITDIGEKNHSDIIPTNIITTTPSTVTSLDGSSKIPVQSTNVNDIVNKVDATTETMASSGNEPVTASSGINATSKTPFTGDVIKQNNSEIILNNVSTQTSNIKTSFEGTNNNTLIQNSSVHEAATKANVATDTTVSSVTDITTVAGGMDVTSTTLSITDIGEKNHSDIIPTNIITTTPSTVTSLDGSSKIPVQSTNVNDIVNKVDATTETMASSGNEPVTASSGINATSKTPFTGDVIKQNNSEIILNNVSTQTSNIKTSFEGTNNNTLIQNSSVHEAATKANVATDTTVSSVTDITTVAGGMDVTSTTLSITDIGEQNHSDIIPTNIITTTPSTVTSLDGSSKIPVQNTNVNDIVNKVDATTETMASSGNEPVTASSGINATSKTPFTGDVIKQNTSEIILNNVSTQTSNIKTSFDGTYNNTLIQNSSVNEVATKANVATDTTVSSVSDITTVAGGMDVTSTTLSITDIGEQNHSDIIPTNIITTTPSTVTSLDGSSKIPVQNTSVSDIVNKADAATETMTSSANELLTASSGINATSKTPFTGDVIKQNNSEIILNNVSTPTSNIKTSFEGTNNNTLIQNSSVNEVATKANVATDTTVSSVTDITTVAGGMDVTSTTLSITDIGEQNHSDIIPTNIITTTPSTVTSLDGSSKIPVQNTNVNDIVNKVDATTETMASSGNEPVTASSGINATSKTPFTGDVIKQNTSEIILNNVSTQTSNIKTSFDGTYNNTLIQNSSVNEVATKANVATDTTVSSVSDITTVAGGMDVTSTTLSITDIGEQNHSDIIPTNIITTTPSTVTSLDGSSKIPVQNTSVSDIVNKADAATETMTSSANELLTASSGINATSKTPFTGDVIKQNNSEIILNNVSTPTSNIKTSFEGTNNNTLIQNSSVNEVATKANVATDTTVSSVTDITTVAGGMDVTSTTLSITDIGEQNHSDIIPTNIITTTPSTVTSLDGSSKIPVQNTNVNDIVNKVDATTETMASSGNEPVTASSGINATSKTPFTGDVIKQNTSEIILNNVSTQTSNIKTSFDGTYNNTLIQNSSVNEVATKANVATDTTVSSVSDITTVAGGMDVTSTTLSITDIGEQNHSDIIPTNIITTTPSTVTSLDGSSKIPVQNTSVSDIVNKADAVTETMTSSANELLTASSGINATFKTPFTGDVIKQNNSEIILNNVSTPTSNIKTSFEGTNNNTLIQNSSVNEVATKANVATDTTVSSVTDITTVAGGMDVTSTILSITDIGEQNHSDIIPTNIITTTPSTVTSLDASSKVIVQNTSVSNIVNKVDATTETMASLANEPVTASSGINATSKTPFTGNIIKHNNSEIILNNVSTPTSNIKTSFDGTNNNTLIQNSSVNEAATKANVATDTTVSSVTGITTVAGGMDVISTTLSITDIGEQNHSDIIPTNITTTTPSTVTSLDGSSQISVQNTSVNDIVTKVVTTTKTMTSSANEPITTSSGINSTSKTTFAEDVIKQNNSEIILNNGSSLTSNIVSSLEGTNNNTLIQNSSVNEAATKADVFTDTTVSSITDISTVTSGMDVTSTTLSITEIGEQNHSDIIPSNITTTTPSTVTSQDGTSKIPVQNKSVSDIVNKIDAATETMASSANELVTASSGMNATSTTPFTGDVIKQNNSETILNNVSTPTSNIKTSFEGTNNNTLIQNSSVNEADTKANVATDTTVSSVTDITTVAGGMDVTSTTLSITEIGEQNHSDIIPSNITATTPSTVSSLDGSSQIAVQNTSVNDIVTKVDTTTKTMASSANEPITTSSGINSTSKTTFAEDVIKQNNSEIILNNGSSLTSNIISSFEGTNNNTLIQNSSVNEAATKADIFTDTTVSSVTDISTVTSGMDVTSTTLSITEIGEQNHSDIIPSNITATTPSTVTSLDGSSKIPVQNTSVNDIVTKVDTTTKTMASSANELVTASSGMNATSTTPFTGDVIKQNNSEIILNNVSTPTSNIKTSFEGTNNNTLIQNSSVNEAATKANVGTDTTVSSVTDVTTVAGGMDVTSTTLSITEIGEQNHSDIIPSNITATTPSTVTSLDGSSQIAVQNTSVNDIVTKVDTTTKTMASSANEPVTTSSGINSTSKTTFTEDVIKQNNSEIILNNGSTPTSNIKTSFEGTNNNTLIQNSSVNEAATKANVATDTTVSSVSDITTVAGGMDVTSTTLSITDIGEQNHSDIIPANIITTTPSTVTSLDGSSKIPVQYTNVNDIVNKVDATTETMASSANEPVTASSGINATSTTPFTGDVIKQNNSEIILNNVSTPTSNIITNFEGTNNNILIQSSNGNEAANKADVSIIAGVSSVIEPTTVASEMDVIFTTLSVTDIGKHNRSDIIPNNITSTASSIVTSLDESNKIPALMGSINEIVNKTDATKETMASSATESVIKQNSSWRINKTSMNPISKLNVLPTTYDNLVTIDDSLTSANNSEFSITLNVSGSQNNRDIVKILPNYKQNNTLPFINNNGTKIKNTYDIKQEKTNPTVTFDGLETVRNSSLPPSKESSVLKVSHNDSMITNEPITTRRDNDTSYDKMVKGNQTTFVNSTALMFDESHDSKKYLTTEDNTNITVPVKENVPIPSTEKYISQRHNESVQTISPSIQIHNTNNSNHIYNESVIQSNIRRIDNANNTPHEDDEHQTSFSCQHRSRGKYTDNLDCRKFYICIGREEPIVGMCPINTVFSRFRKQCTSNLTHCLRNTQFHCTSEGRFSDSLQNNIYYICVKGEADKFLRFKLQCQHGYYLNKTSLHCTHKLEETSSSSSSGSENSNTQSDQSETKSSSYDPSRSESTGFQCKKEGKFADPSNRRQYFVCSRNKRFGYRVKKKFCDDDKTFDSDKMRCVDDDSIEY